MRAVAVATFVLLLSFSVNTIGEINSMVEAETGYKWIPVYETGQYNLSGYDTRTFNDTMDKYGGSRVPTQGNLGFEITNVISSIGMIYDYVVGATIGFGHSLKSNFFPSMPETMAYGIDAMIFLDLIFLIVSLWRSWRP